MLRRTWGQGALVVPPLPVGAELFKGHNENCEWNTIDKSLCHVTMNGIDRHRVPIFDHANRHRPMFDKNHESRQSDRPRHRTIQDIEREIAKLQQDMGFYRHQSQAVELKASLEARLVALREELSRRRSRDSEEQVPKPASSSALPGTIPGQRSSRAAGGGGRSEAGADGMAAESEGGDLGKAAAAKRRKLRMAWASDLRKP